MSEAKNPKGDLNESLVSVCIEHDINEEEEMKLQRLAEQQKIHTAHLAQMKLSLELYASSLKENFKKGNHLEETSASAHTNGITEPSKSSRPSVPSKVFRIESKKHPTVSLMAGPSTVVKGAAAAKPAKKSSATSRWQDSMKIPEHSKTKSPSFGIFQSQQAPLSSEATSMKAIFSSRERSPGYNFHSNLGSSPYLETLKQRKAIELQISTSATTTAALQMYALKPGKKTPRTSTVGGSGLSGHQKPSVSSSPKSASQQLKMTGVQQLQSQLLGKHSTLASSIPPSQVKQPQPATSNSNTPLNLGKTLCLQNGQFFSPQTSKTSITGMVPQQSSGGGSVQMGVTSLTETRKKFFINPKPLQSRVLDF